jgi:hypothetical protein
MYNETRGLVNKAVRFINMKSAVILIIMIFTNIAYASEEQIWEIEFGWHSGWGISQIHTIDSLGKTEFLRTNDSGAQVCKKRLEEEKIIKIEEKIKAIPNNLPLGTLIQYLDNCKDERENYIYLIKGNVKRGFQYSREERCWDTTVPKWLISLFSELENNVSSIVNCEVEVK